MALPPSLEARFAELRARLREVARRLRIGHPRQVRLSAVADVYAVTGVSAYFEKSTPQRSIEADAGSYATTGVAATLNYAPAPGGSVSMTANRGIYTVSGAAAILTAPAPPSVLQPNMWPAVETSGTVDVDLYPSQGVSGSTVVAFCVPMPRGFLSSVANCRLETVSGAEIAADVSELLKWRHLTDPTIDGQSVRSVFIATTLTFLADTTQRVVFRWGPAVSRTLSAGLGITSANVYASSAWRSKAPPKTGEHPATDSYERDTSRNLTTYPLATDEMDAQDITEPKVFAGFPQAFLQKCNLRGLARQHNNSDWMRYLTGFAKTSINDVWLTATKYQTEIIPEIGGQNDGGLTDWISNYETWLYDRVGALANVYAITGDVKWLRHTHRAAQYFREYMKFPGLTSPGGPVSKYVRGAFTKRPMTDAWDSGDGKYLSTSGLLMSYILTGDGRLYDKIIDIFNFFEVTPGYLKRLPPAIANQTGLYTERVLAQMLTSALSAFEITGDVAYKNKTQQIFAGYRADQLSPPAGYPAPQGWLLHDQWLHREGDSTTPITWFASPWMSVVLLEAVWKYFLFSADEDALRFISDLGGAMVNRGTYTGLAGTANPPDGTGQYETWRAVYYFVNESTGGTDVGIDGDIEHSPEMVGAFLRTKWANQRLGRPTTDIDAKLPLLRQSALWALGGWRRSATYLAEYRLAPKRKFNWWFGENYDEQWLLTETGTA